MPQLQNRPINKQKHFFKAEALAAEDYSTLMETSSSTVWIVALNLLAFSVPLFSTFHIEPRMDWIGGD